MIEKKINLPSHKKLIELEKKAKIEGSGIDYDSLLGLWKFKSVWRQSGDKEDSISSSLLQVLSATLELKTDKQEPEKELFTISNSIKFGIFSLRFSGPANLERKQPLLIFSFDCIEIKLASLIILKRSLQTAKQSKRPFFGLIAIDSNGKWLSARGKGGGLALWESDS
tara:strand:+ start:2559 stop:3062 length:504 start_codon:yes stop_codon:yes gene_type:complete